MKKYYIHWYVVVIGIMLTTSALPDSHQPKEKKDNIATSNIEDGRILSISSRRIDINLGRVDGVKRGMGLEIYRAKILYDVSVNRTQTIKESLGMGLVIDVDQNRSTLYLSNFEVKTTNRDKMSPPLIDIGTNVRLVRLPTKSPLDLGRHSILVRKFEGTGSDIEERLAESDTDQLAASLDNGPLIPFKSDHEVKLTDPDGNEIYAAFGKNAGEGIASFQLLYKVDREIIIVPGLESKPLHTVEIYDRIKRPPQDLIEHLQQLSLGEAMIVGIKGEILQIAGIDSKQVGNGDQLTLTKTPKEIIHPVTGQLITLGVRRELQGIVSAVSDNVIELSIPDESVKGFYTDDMISVTKE